MSGSWSATTITGGTWAARSPSKSPLPFLAKSRRPECCYHSHKISGQELALLGLPLLIAARGSTARGAKENRRRSCRRFNTRGSKGEPHELVPSAGLSVGAVATPG